MGCFKWLENTCQFSKDFIENYNKDTDEEYFLDVDVQYVKNLLDLQNDLHFLPERTKIETFEKLVTNLHIEKEYVVHIRKH